MMSRKAHESMDRLDKINKVVQQSSTKGMRAVEIARKLHLHRATVHRHLTSLDLMGRVEGKQGIWYAKTGEQTIKPLEKEIEIILPLPKKQMQHVTSLELLVKQSEEMGWSHTGNVYKTILEKLKETRTIRLRGKNVDDLDLQKIGNMIKEANKKSSKFNFKGLFKNKR